MSFDQIAHLGQTVIMMVATFLVWYWGLGSKAGTDSAEQRSLRRDVDDLRKELEDMPSLIDRRFEAAGRKMSDAMTDMQSQIGHVLTRREFDQFREYHHRELDSTKRWCQSLQDRLDKHAQL